MMIDGNARTLVLVAALGAGLSAGVFFAFSTFVMTALGKLPAPQGISAMNAINKAAPTPLFMLALFGTGILCVFLGVSGMRHLDTPGAKYLLAGSAVFLVSVLLTMGYHVPQNNALLLVNPNAANAAGKWHTFRTGWIAWNHVRTLSALAGATLLTLAWRAG